MAELLPGHPRDAEPCSHQTFAFEAAQQQLNHSSLLITEQRYAVPLEILPDRTSVLEQLDVFAD